MENFCNGLNVLKTAPSISKNLFFIKEKPYRKPDDRSNIK